MFFAIFSCKYSIIKSQQQSHVHRCSKSVRSNEEDEEEGTKIYKHVGLLDAHTKKKKLIKFIFAFSNINSVEQPVINLSIFRAVFFVLTIDAFGIMK
jgi:hypothetical protein